MNVEAVVAELKQQYPGANIVVVDDDGFLEIVAEVEPSSDHAEYSRAIIVAGKSKPHYHKVSTETYKVLKGELVVAINDKTHNLTAGEEITILPYQIHSIAAKEAWFETISEPGWTLDDHIFEK